jgi:hypothetical protein
MRDIVHQARLIDRADWPADDPNYLRNLARVRNEIGNAIYFADYKGNHAGAIELLFDQLHIYDLMCEAPTKGDWRRTFVSRASISRVVYPLALLVTADTLTNDPADHQNIQIATARKLIDVLLSQRDPDAELTEIYRGEGASFPHRPPDEDATMIRDLKRANAEQSMAAMAVAIQLFKHDKGRWPMSAVELMPDYLAKLPIDPWGDGKVSLGYVNIKSGLPDGTNRPMVYSREDSKDGLFFLAHNPSYKSYVGDASQMPLEQQKHGGQFRDIVRWEPTENLFGPSTLPLP